MSDLKKIQDVRSQIGQEEAPKPPRATRFQLLSKRFFCSFKPGLGKPRAY